MSEDSFGLNLGVFGLNFHKKDVQQKLNEGDTILIRYWSWRKLGYIRKTLTLRDGHIAVKRVN